MQFFFIFSFLNILKRQQLTNGIYFFNHFIIFTFDLLSCHSVQPFFSSFALFVALFALCCPIPFLYSIFSCFLFFHLLRHQAIFISAATSLILFLSRKPSFAARIPSFSFLFSNTQWEFQKAKRLLLHNYFHALLVPPPPPPMMIVLTIL